VTDVYQPFFKTKCCIEYTSPGRFVERSKKKLLIIDNIPLLSFDEVNVWIYRLLKKIIFIELEGRSEYNLFSKVNYQTFGSYSSSDCKGQYKTRERY
jgi:hypothetical protein